MRMIAGCVLAVVLVAGSAMVAQQPEPGVDRLVQQYITAFNKGDVNALTALYVDNAMRTGGEQMLAGKQAIQAFYTQGFAGEMKGAKLMVKQGRTQSINPDLRVQEGTWELTGAQEGPQRGSYLNTYVRQGGEWRIAAVATIPETTPAK